MELKMSSKYFKNIFIALILAFSFENTSASETNCSDKRVDLRKRLEKCKTNQCKNTVKKLIENLNCSDQAVQSNSNSQNGASEPNDRCVEKKKELIEERNRCKKNEPNCKKRLTYKINELDCSKIKENEDSSNTNIDTSGIDCRQFKKVLVNKEPIDEEGYPDTTKFIRNNIAYRLHPKGINGYVKNFKPISEAVNGGKKHPQLKGTFKKLPDIGAFEKGKAYPSVGASLPKWNFQRTNLPEKALKQRIYFLPHKAIWVELSLDNQDDI